MKSLDLALLEGLSTPCYLFDEEELSRNFSDFAAALRDAWSPRAFVAYSVKTNPFPWILEVAKRQGCLAEVVSDEEYARALACGYEPHEIVFNGPIKGRARFESALAGGSYVNIDSWREIAWLEERAGGISDPVSVGIRVNFDLESACPGETVTGAKGGRFGFCLENGELARAIDRIRALGEGVSIAGIHMHVTTASRSLKVYEALSRTAVRVISEFALKPSFVDIGGGFYGGGPRNAGAYESYAQTIASVLREACDPTCTDLIVEPGGAVVCTPASYIGRVLDAKTTAYDRFVTCDLSRINIDHEMKKTSYAHVLHLNPRALRPDDDRLAAADAPDARALEARPRLARQVLCGYTCMESDRLCVLEDAPRLDVGDFVEIRNAGAYSMSFTPEFFIRHAPAVYALGGDGAVREVRPLRRDDLLSR